MIVGKAYSNPADGMDVPVLYKQQPLRRADHWFRGILSALRVYVCVRVCIIVCDLENSKLGPSRAVAPQKERKKDTV